MDKEDLKREMEQTAFDMASCKYAIDESVKVYGGAFPYASKATRTWVGVYFFVDKPLIKRDPRLLELGVKIRVIAVEEEGRNYTLSGEDFTAPERSGRILSIKKGSDEGWKVECKVVNEQGEFKKEEPCPVSKEEVTLSLNRASVRNFKELIEVLERDNVSRIAHCTLFGDIPPLISIGGLPTDLRYRQNIEELKFRISSGGPLALIEKDHIWGEWVSPVIAYGYANESHYMGGNIYLRKFTREEVDFESYEEDVPAELRALLQEEGVTVGIPHLIKNR